MIHHFILCIVFFVQRSGISLQFVLIDSFKDTIIYSSNELMVGVFKLLQI